MNNYKKFDNISDGAWSVLTKLHYVYNHKNKKYINDISVFNFDFQTLTKYCIELEDAGYILFEGRTIDDFYIYLLLYGLPDAPLARE